MPRKKKEDTVEETSGKVNETESPGETSIEAKSGENSANAKETATGGNTEEPGKTAGKKTSEDETVENAVAEEPSLISSVLDAVTSVVGGVAEAVVGGATNLVNAVAGDDNADDSSATAKKTSKRAEKIGTVQSDKMTKTVTVRVDRVLKHQMYRKYVKRRKKFMAHDELGAKIGDKVRIVETRPLSAKKRWRVIEIIQKAEQ